MVGYPHLHRFTGGYSSGPPSSMAAGGDSAAILYRILVDRCRQLESSQSKFREELDELAQEKIKNGAGSGELPGNFLAGSPYRSLLDSLGNSVHVCSASSGTIIFWNRAAENLYGWTSYEALGQRDTDMLVVEGYHEPLNKIMDDIVNTGCSWSGQLPFRKRSSEMFMALVTKSAMYEDGELVGFVTLSSDAAVFKRLNGREDLLPDCGRGRGTNTRRIQWHPPRPQIASSVSNLASRFLNRKQANDACSSCGRSTERRNDTTNSEEAPEKLNVASKFLARLHIRGTADHGNQLEETVERNFRNDNTAGSYMRIPSIHGYESSKLRDEKHVTAASMSCNGKFKLVGGDYSGNGYEYQVNENDLVQDVRNTQGSSGKGYSDLDAMADCEVKWEDLQLGDEIGHGFFATVYRGSWNGSEVAVKVYSQNQHNESALEDHRKEIDIMMKLRHPNVLLFMGAVYSHERPAIVTEFMPRGSLFKTLHTSNQALDTKRRLKMALDVARGMNYLHCRNPPIVHRDLKSANLLVDRNWTVKVGDFGLSRWKEATFLSTKSGRGTAQWMAPEVLRDEPSNEKSDVFSFGVVLWELVTVSIPWSHLNSLQVVGVVGFMDRRLELPQGIDPQVESIIHDCWRSEPQHRPSFGDIIHRMCSVVQKFGPASGRTR